MSIGTRVLPPDKLPKKSPQHLNGYKKIITAYYDLENELVCITGSQGGARK